MREFLEAGRITGTHGVRGDVKAEVWCDDYETFRALTSLYLADGNGYRQYTVTKNTPYKGHALIHLEGYDDLDTVQELRGRPLFAARADLHLPDDRVFIADILGLPVIDTASGQLYGTLRDVSEGGAGQLYEIERADGSMVYLPAIKEFIDRIEDENAVFVRPPEGLF